VDRDVEGGLARAHAGDMQGDRSARRAEAVLPGFEMLLAGDLDAIYSPPATAASPDGCPIVRLYRIAADRTR